MKKIEVNTEGCIGCGACFQIDPEHFAPNEEGYSHVINEENTETENVQNAIESCPVGVISYQECDECSASEETKEE